MVNIRRAEEKDIPAICKLLYEVAEIHRGIRPDIFNANAKKYSTGELSSIIGSYNTPVFVAEEADRILGYAFCVFMQSEGKLLKRVKTLYIDDLCVDESERGKHIGKELYEHVLKFAKANGCYNVTLNVWAGNENAIAFYKKMGLKPQKITMESIIKL